MALTVRDIMDADPVTVEPDDDVETLVGRLREHELPGVPVVNEGGRCIGIAFSCSQKTLPVSLLLFDEYYKTAYPLAVVPLLCYHAGQLLLDTLIAQRLVKTGKQSLQAPG